MVSEGFHFPYVYSFRLGEDNEEDRIFSKRFIFEWS
jgi:hypothetical protein